MIGLSIRRMRLPSAIAYALLLGLAAGCARPAMSNDPFSSPELSPIADAVRRGDGAEIRRQLESVDVDAPGSDGSTLLFEAIRRRRVESVETLMAAGADPNRRDARGDTPMHAAAFSGDPGLLRAVIAGGGDVDARATGTGVTPLVPALRSPSREQYKVLLEAGADPGVADRNGGTPLHTAASTNNGQAILDLLASGASPLARDATGASFQTYYFNYDRALLNDRARDERRRVVAWLKANGIPLEAGVGEADQG